MKKDIILKSHDGGSFSAFVSYPDTDLPAPGVVVIQEIFGVNKDLRKVTDHLSQAGYLAICPDLFWRQEAGVQLDDSKEAEKSKALDLMQGFDINLGIEDLKTALTHIRSQPESTGKAATVGFGLGGNLAFLMAARSDADCNISYYGTGIEDVLDEAPQIKKPLLMHLAEKDRYVPLTAQEKILATLNKMPKVDAWVYPGVDHAFARIGSGTYDKGAAQQANYATADFLATHIAKHRT